MCISKMITVQAQKNGLKNIHLHAQLLGIQEIAQNHPRQDKMFSILPSPPHPRLCCDNSYAIRALK